MLETRHSYILHEILAHARVCQISDAFFCGIDPWKICVGFKRCFVGFASSQNQSLHYCVFIYGMIAHNSVELLLRFSRILPT